MTEKEAKELIGQLKNMDLLERGDYLYKKDEIVSECRFGKKTEIPPLVTIIIPAYRRPELFRIALKSAIEQKNFDDYQILITDDSDELAIQNEKIVRELASDKVIYYKNAKPLGWYNWNRLIELSESKWICMLHDDDVLNCNHLYYMSQLLTKCPEAGMLACDRTFMMSPDAGVMIAEGDINTRTVRKHSYKEWNFRYGSFMLGAWIDRGKLIEQGGFFDGIISLDYHFVVKMAMNYGYYSSDLATYGYGIYSNESMKSDMWEKMLISEYYLCQSMIQHRASILRPILRRLEEYSMACHIEDMSHPSMNIYGVEIDVERICEWLGIRYEKKDSVALKTMMKIYNMIFSS